MPKKKTRLNNKYSLLAAAIASIIVVVALLEVTNTTHFFHRPTVPGVIPTHSNGPLPVNDNKSSSSSTSGTTENTQGAPASNEPPATEHTLVAPTGNFVSNHFPGQSGSPTSEASTCDTTPGANCYIKFTKIDSGESTQLPSQTTDSRGSTSWYWDVKDDAHLTSGQWKITAVATLGNQNKSTDDALKLTIQ